MAESPSPAARRRMLQRLLQSITSRTRLRHSGGSDTNHAALWITGLAGEVTLESLVALANKHALEEWGIPRLVTGVSSSFTHPQNIYQYYLQAVHAVQAQIVDPQCDYRWEHIGVYKYFSHQWHDLGPRVSAAGFPTGQQPEEDPSLARHRNRRNIQEQSVESLKLIEDSPEAETLLDTLEAIYDSPDSKEHLAQRLHLHRATLYNRLAKIEKIIGKSPMDPAHRLELHLALKLRRWNRRPHLLPEAS